MKRRAWPWVFVAEIDGRRVLNVHVPPYNNGTAKFVIAADWRALTVFHVRGHNPGRWHVRWWPK